MYLAACAGHPDPDIFFPEVTQGRGHQGRAIHSPAAKAAREICASCPVRVDCQSFALDNDGIVGIWGGLLATQREQIRTRRAS